MKKLRLSLFALGLAGIISLGVLQIGVAPVVQAKTGDTFVLEVAQDFRTFVLHPADPAAPGARGDVGLVNGNIYPEGTITPGFNGTFDPDAESGIGTWRCLVAVLGESESPLSGAVTYYFSLGETDPGSEKSMLIVQGLNSHLPPRVSRILAIVGGTGEFSGATGEVLEEVIGTNTTNPTFALNLRYHIKLKKQAPK